MSMPFIVSFHWCFCASHCGDNADNGGQFYDGGDEASYCGDNADNYGGEFYDVYDDDDDGPVIEELKEDDDRDQNEEQAGVSNDNPVTYNLKTQSVSLKLLRSAVNTPNSPSATSTARRCS